MMEEELPPIIYWTVPYLILRLRPSSRNTYLSLYKDYQRTSTCAKPLL